MGQPLPLPEKIPQPNEEILTSMKNDGINILGEPQDEFVKYSLPEGWKMRDVSERQDLPNYYIVDENDNAKYSIDGTWKGSFDNYLELKIAEKKKVLPKENGMERNQASDVSLVSNLIVDNDPLKRPHNLPDILPNKDDYVPKY